MLKRSGIDRQRGISPTFLEELIGGTVIHLKRRRGRYESRGSERGPLNRGSPIEELTNKLDVSFTSLTCGRSREIMKLGPEVSVLLEA